MYFIQDDTFSKTSSIIIIIIVIIIIIIIIIINFIITIIVIIILVRGNLKAEPHFFIERMSSIEVYSNDVNGTVANSEGVVSSRCPVE